MQNETPTTSAQPSFSPKTVRRQPNRHERRAAFRNQNPKRNDGKYVGTGNRQIMQIWNDQAIYTPRRHKLKGYEKEAKRRSRKHAA